MKLYEFVDKLYEMGEMEAPKTVRPKKTLNEALNEALFSDSELEEYLRKYLNPELSLAGVEVYNSGNHAEVQVQLEPEVYNNDGYGYTFNFVPKETSVEDFFDYVVDSLNNVLEDDLDEGILGGLAGAAIGGLAGNSLGHPILGAIGGGLAGSAIQNALNDDLDESYDYELFNDLCKDYEVSNMSLNDIFEEVLEKYGDEGLADDVVAEVEAARESMYDDYDEEDDLYEDKDLSTVSGSMTKILQDNREKIDACGSAKEVHDTVAGLLAEAGLDTQATRRLLLTLKKQKGLTGALQAVYNSILKGSDLGTLK